MKICLINPPQILSKRFGTPYVFQPLGLLYVAASLEKKHRVEVLDASLEGWENLRETGDRYYLGLTLDEIRERLSTVRPDVVGISVPFSVNEASALAVASLVKAMDRNMTTVLGGAHVSVRPLETLASPDVDFIVIGEGEESAPELLDVLGEGSRSRLKDIRGIGYKENGGGILTPAREKITDLDSLAWPARHLVPMEKYFQAMALKQGARRMYTYDERSISLITSRGCPYDCNFCSIHLTMGKRFRARSPESVVAEIEEAKKAYGIRHVNFEDDNLTLDRERAARIFDLMVDSGLDVTWSAPNGIRSEALDEALIQKMKRSGCRRVFVAPESGSERVLKDIIKKDLDLEKIGRAVTLFKKYDIAADGSFVIGFIGETKKDIDKTIRYALRLKRSGLQAAGFHIATPYYGTELYREAVRKGYLRKDLDSSLFTTTEPLIGTPEWSMEEIRRLRASADWIVNTSLSGKIFDVLQKCQPLWQSFRFIKNCAVFLWKAPGKAWRWLRSFAPFVKNICQHIILDLRREWPKVAYVVYEVTDACNSRCRHCCIWSHKPTENILTVPEVKKIFSDEFFSDVKVILLTGGEPVLRDDIKELIQSLHESRPNAEISLSTNGILAERVLETVRDAVARGIKLNVGISLDAVGDRHDFIRGVKGNFEKTEYLLKELSRLKEEHPDKLGSVVIGHTLSDLTVDTLQEVLDYAKRLKLTCMTQLYEEFVYYHNIDNKNASNYRRADNKALIEALRRFPSSFNNEVLIRALQHKLRYRCTALRKFFLLRCDGSVAPCLNYGDISAGNLRLTSPGEIWKGAAAQKARRTVARCPGCSNSWAVRWSMEDWFLSFFGLVAKLDIKYLLKSFK